MWKDDDTLEDHQELHDLVVDRSLKVSGAVDRPAKPFDAAAAAVGRVALEESRRHKAQLKKAKEKAYEQAMEDLLGMAHDVQFIALEKALGQARLSDGSFDPQNVASKDLQLAIKTAWEVANRVKGRPTSKVETKTEHSFLLKLEQDGELD